MPKSNLVPPVSKKFIPLKLFAFPLALKFKFKPKFCSLETTLFRLKKNSTLLSFYSASLSISLACSPLFLSSIPRQLFSSNDSQIHRPLVNSIPLLPLAVGQNPRPISPLVLSSSLKSLNLTPTAKLQRLLNPESKLQNLEITLNLC